ncbi:MAG: hypothetical protein AB7E47_01180 [Desulfovibrionaceae bacterium]
MDFFSLFDLSIFSRMGTAITDFLGGNSFILLAGIGIPVTLYAIFIYKKYQIWIRSFIQCNMNASKRREKDPLLKKIIRRKVPVEVFTVEDNTFIFACKGRITEFDDGQVLLKIVYYKGEVAFSKNQLVLVHTTPMRFQGTYVNCFKTFIKEVGPRQLLLKRMLHFEFIPRRSRNRKDIKNQNLIKVRCWFAVPAIGPNTFEFLHPNIAMNLEPRTDEAALPRVSNLSVDGIGLQISYAMRTKDYRPDEAVCANVLIFDDEAQDYRQFWVGGIMRNIEEDRNQSIYVGIQFTAIADRYSEEDMRFNWRSMEMSHTSDELETLISRL